jgi:hypothetical protein
MTPATQFINAMQRDRTAPAETFRLPDVPRLPHGVGFYRALGFIPHRTPDTLCVYAVAHSEHWVIVFEDSTEIQACRVLGRWAAEPELALTWHDTARMAARVRDLVCKGR